MLGTYGSQSFKEIMGDRFFFFFFGLWYQRCQHMFEYPHCLWAGGYSVDSSMGHMVEQARSLHYAQGSERQKSYSSPGGPVWPTFSNRHSSASLHTSQ